MIRVLLADDHDVVLAGLSALLRSEPDVEVVGQVMDGDAAVKKATDLVPDVVLLDLSMPRLNGIDAARRIRETCPTSKLLGLSVHEDRPYILQFLRAGASGYLSKRAAAAEVVKAIRIVAAGGVYLESSTAGPVLASCVKGRGRKVGEEGPSLSERETDVVRYVARGYTNKEIANLLQVSIKSVETYKARSMEKLGARSRCDLVRYALQQGWLDTV